MHCQFRPLTTWPGPPTQKRKRSPFAASYSRTLTDLDRELVHLGANQLVIQAAVEERDIRLDGMLRADAKMRSPGVILSFESKIGPLSYPCDTYTEWPANVRAIALTLAALRAIDRYGVTARAEQYRGWQALPAPSGDPRAKAARAAAACVWGSRWGGWAEVLARFSGWTIQQVLDDPEGAWREGSARTHPDRGGNADHFRAVQQAGAVFAKGLADA